MWQCVLVQLQKLAKQNNWNLQQEGTEAKSSLT